jgi:hypothetical protein
VLLSIPLLLLLQVLVSPLADNPVRQDLDFQLPSCYKHNLSGALANTTAAAAAAGAGVTASRQPSTAGP